MRLRYLTAGESHGPALTVIVEGLPAGIPVAREAIDRLLRRRMGGHGRGGRMKIENDRVELLGGVRFGRTLGSPVSVVIHNLDHENWRESMAVDGPRPDDETARAVSRPRPGHADLAGALKYGTHDARDILERASARETAARTAAGSLAMGMLGELGVEVTSRTVSVGEARAADADAADFDALLAIADDEPMRALQEKEAKAMIAAVDDASSAGDSIGGVFEILVRGLPPGLGSHVHWDRKLDGLLAHALMSIPAVKAVSIGEGIENAARRGSETHDEIVYQDKEFRRTSNRAGGIEGGITNGELLRACCYLKPLSTLPRPLKSVDLVSKEPFEATRERTDTIPIVAAGVVGEAMASLVLADAMLEKFGGDRLEETRANLQSYLSALGDF